MSEIAKTMANAPIQGRSFVVSLDNRKRRGSGHERVPEILSAARELFLTQGVENVTTRQIAAKVGISQTALYVYFATKEEMLDQLADLAWRAMGQALDEADDPALDPAQRLRRQLAAAMRFWLQHPDDYRIMFARKILRGCRSSTEHPEGFSGEKLLTRLTAAVEEAAKSGTLRRLGTCQATALAIWTAMSGMVGLRLGYPGFPWPPIDEHIAATLDLIFNGCAARAHEAVRAG